MLVPTTFSEKLADNLWKAIKSGSIDEVISLLDEGADPNHQLYWSEEWISEEKWTPLFIACCIQKNLELVKVLVQRGAAVDKGCGEANFTPLHGACIAGFKKGVEYLIMEAGCKVGKSQAINSQTHTPYSTTYYNSKSLQRLRGTLGSAFIQICDNP